MRRDSIIKAIEKLREALMDSQVREVLRVARAAPQNEDTSLTQKMLMSYSIFSQHHLNFGEGEKYLMSLFGLAPLVNVNFWSGLLDGDRNLSQKMLSDIEVGVYNVIYVMPKFKDLLVRDTDKPGFVIKLQDGLEKEVHQLRIFIAEKGNTLTDTAVVMNVIRSVEELYECFALMNKSGYVALAIGSMDSGDAKTIDFFGNDQVVKDVKATITDVWYKVKHSRNSENMRYQIEVSLMGAGFVNRINELKGKGALSEEESQRITRSVPRAIETLFQNGAYTNDMDKEEDTRASSILQRQVAQIELKSDRSVGDQTITNGAGDTTPQGEVVHHLDTEAQDAEFVEAQ